MGAEVQSKTCFIRCMMAKKMKKKEKKKTVKHAPVKPAKKKAVKSRPAPAKKAMAKPAKITLKVKAKPVGAPKAKSAAAVKPGKIRKPEPRPAIEEPAPAPKIKIKPLPAQELKMYRDLLRTLRDQIVDEISFLAGDNLNRSQRESSGDLSSYSFHMADQGTDNFDREFALNLVSSEQDVLYEIDEALHRIDAGTYGVCEMCGCAIEKARLKALPFAKMCVRCKSEAERGKTRYRPFGATITQSSES